MSKSTLLSVLAEVIEERDSQDENFGEQNHPDHGKIDRNNLAIACSETRAARADSDNDIKNNDVNWCHILQEEYFEAIEEAMHGREENLRAELIQVAAVAVAWIQALDRRQEQIDQIDLTQLMLPF